MPKYVLPKPKKSKKSDSDECAPVCDNDWMRRVHGIPANEEIVGDITVGDEYVVVLRGTVMGADLRKQVDGDPTGGIDITVDSVEVYTESDNEFSKLTDDE